MTLQDLQDRIGTRVAGVIGNPRLGRIVTRVAANFRGAPEQKLLDMAHAEVALIMGTESALYFRYSQGAESVDKTMTAAQFLELAKLLWERHGETGGGTEQVYKIGVKREEEE